MTLPDFAKTRDALQAALADFDRHGEDCDLRIVKQAVVDVLIETMSRLAPAVPHERDFRMDFQTFIDDTAHGFDRAIEDADFRASDPDTIAEGYADYRRDMR